MTGTEILLMSVCFLICIVGLTVVIRMMIRDDPKNWKKELMMTALSELYRISGWAGFLSVAFCFIFPEKVGLRQISMTVIPLLIHFGLMFVDGVKDFDKRNGTF